MSRIKCPHCGCINTMVIDTRATLGRYAIHRIRECRECQKHFGTYEVSADKEAIRQLVKESMRND